MTKQASRVLDHLKVVGNDTDSNIATTLGIPAPSVRRSIQELQREGHAISFASKSSGYTLARL